MAKAASDLPSTDDEYPLLAYMKAWGIEITRESYIALDNMGEPPEDWTPEDEEELPPELRDWSIFGLENGALVLKE